jgi:hypothetical protein
MQEINLRGIIPAIVTPMLDDGALTAGTAAICTMLVNRAPVGCQWDTGEGPTRRLMKTANPETVAELWKANVKSSGSRRPSTAQGISNAARLAAGADALLIFPISAFLGQPLTSGSLPLSCCNC